MDVLDIILVSPVPVVSHGEEGDADSGQGEYDAADEAPAVKLVAGCAGILVVNCCCTLDIDIYRAQTQM